MYEKTSNFMSNIIFFAKKICVLPPPLKAKKTKYFSKISQIIPKVRFCLFLRQLNLINNFELIGFFRELF